ncbi:hypothetical protein V1264_001483 [Littorina saxatilis]|uniref:G-protein coupled receptors family 1 profile domain-containing protein n=1 Tax=Littorina saxatilis TaxID=31220 RepID=A0AAN9GNV6_9CAEN
MDSDTDSDLKPVWKTFPMIYVIVGMFFNYYQFMSVVLKRYRQENIFIYFIVLVLADALVLIMPLLSEWLKVTVNVDIRAMSNGGCRLHVWMSDVAMDVPPWIMVVMAYEKRALLWFPVPADSKFSRNTAKLVMLSLGCFSALRNQHVLWAMGISHNVVVINGSTVPPTTPTTTTTLGVNNVRSQFQSDDDVSKLVCDIGRNSYGIFLTMHRPWIDLMFRVVAPCSCLVVYNGSILWKIYREKFCATRLMRLAAIHPPDWFYLGVLEMEHAVKWTGTLTLFITVNSLPYSFYLICQPSSFGSKHRYNPGFWLVSNLLFYINYLLVFPTFAVQDHALLLIMRDTWRLPLSRKRGTNTASMAPRITPEQRMPTVEGVFQKAFSRLNQTGGKDDSAANESLQLREVENGDLNACKRRDSRAVIR